MKPDPKDPRVRLLHMLEACDRTARLVEDRTREDLDATVYKKFHTMPAQNDEAGHRKGTP